MPSTELKRVWVARGQEPTLGYAFCGQYGVRVVTAEGWDVTSGFVDNYQLGVRGRKLASGDLVPENCFDTWDEARNYLISQLSKDYGNMDEDLHRVRHTHQRIAEAIRNLQTAQDPEEGHNNGC